jgi:Tat protein translocase TatB subunit
MFNVGGPEVLVILLVALIALGPAQLPEAARKVGKAMNEVRKVSTNFQRELTNAFDLEEQKTKEKPQSPGGPTDVSLAAEGDDEDEVVFGDDVDPEWEHVDESPEP